MIKIETVEINGMTFTKTYSDNGLKIRKIGTNEIYTETYDVLNFEYEETAEQLAEMVTNGEITQAEYDQIVGA